MQFLFLPWLFLSFEENSVTWCLLFCCLLGCSIDSNLNMALGCTLPVDNVVWVMQELSHRKTDWLS